jgi:hypothetical protein
MRKFTRSHPGSDTSENAPDTSMPPTPDSTSDSEECASANADAASEEDGDLLIISSAAQDADKEALLKPRYSWSGSVRRSGEEFRDGKLKMRQFGGLPMQGLWKR